MTAPVQVDLGYRPRQWQLECHRKRQRFTVLVLHRRAGKTELALRELLDKALRCTLDLGMFVYLAPYLKQAKAIAWQRLKRMIEPLRLLNAVEVIEGELSVRVKANGAVIRVFGADNPDALRGLRLDGVVVDETGQIKSELWTDVLQPALSDRLGWALFIGTPAGINLFSELYYYALRAPGWWAALYTVNDTQSLNPAEVERLRTGGMPENSFAREYLCDFTASGDDQLISLSDAEIAARRVYQERDVATSPRILGVDPARFGDDRSVIVRRQGLQMFTPRVFAGIDNMDLAARVASEIEEWQPDATFIDSGAGAGVIDRLRQLGYAPIEVAFGGKATLAGAYANKRTEMWWTMREWLQSGGAIPDDVALKQELATPIYWFDATGKKVLEPKADVKKRLQGGRSPDIGDALALTFAFPVTKPAPLEQFQEQFGVDAVLRRQQLASRRGEIRRDPFRNV